jgi:hypothetical protein
MQNAESTKQNILKRMAPMEITQAGTNGAILNSIILNLKNKCARFISTK